MNFQWLLVPFLSLALGLGLVACGNNTEPALLLEINCEQCGKGDSVQEGCDSCLDIASNALNQTLPDIDTARAMYAKGCQVHHPPSCAALAEMVRDGRGGPRDLKRASGLFEIACEKGNIQQACTEVALSEFDGVGQNKDQEAAVARFEIACNHPEDPQAKACAALGLAHLMGAGVKRKDEGKAIELLTRSCEADYPSGCVQMGAVFEKRTRGKHTENRETAADAYERACKLDARHGCYELADLHESKKAIDPSAEKAAIFYQKTCNTDPTRGCYEAAELMAEGRVTARDGEIASLYNIACEHGHGEACSKRAQQ
jgi:TPR repeat protein